MAPRTVACASDIRYAEGLIGEFMATQVRDEKQTTAVRRAWLDGDYRRVAELASAEGVPEEARKLSGGTTIDHAALAAGALMFVVVAGLFLSFVGRG